MSVGAKLNRKITIERPTTTDSGGYGQQPGPWEVFADRIWAEAKDMVPSRTEAAKMGVRVAAQQTRIRIRNRPGITSDMRITLHGAEDKVFQIVGGPAEVEGRVLIEMLCEAYSV
jgi:SPP1 family predicted phage head-tail adaptor